MLVAALAFVLVAAVGSARRAEPPLPVPAAQAVAIAAGAPEIHAQARAATSTSVDRVDDHLERVTFLRHGVVTASAGVRDTGDVFQPFPVTGHQSYGAPVTHHTLAFAALTALFLLAALRRPLRLVPALDALALGAAVVPTVLLDHGRVGAGQGAGALLLLYLAARCVAIAVGPGAPPFAGRPLLAVSAAPRLPVLAAGAVAVVVAVVTTTSTGSVDVAFATMEGATKLLHGVLPYGHLPGDVVHGDTYGLPAYAAYVPAALLWPVSTTWDETTGALLMAAVLTLAGAWGIARALGGDRAAGLLVGLAFPSVLLTASSGTNDVLIFAALAWALVWCAHPRRSTVLVTAAALAKVAPLALVPLWVARYRGRARLGAIGAAIAVGAAVLAALLALGGLHGPSSMLDAMSFQLGRRSLSSVYGALGLGALQPLAQGLAVATVLGGTTLLAFDDAAARDPRRLAALCAAALALCQLAANYWAPLYLMWLLPPAAVALLGRSGEAPADPFAGDGGRAACRPEGTPRDGVLPDAVHSTLEH